MMIFDAIKQLYPKAIYIKEREGEYIAEDKDYKKIELDMEAVNAKAAELETAAETAATNKSNAKTSGIEKLKADTWSPLTDDEIQALFGE